MKLTVLAPVLVALGTTIGLTAWRHEAPRRSTSEAAAASLVASSSAPTATGKAPSLALKMVTDVRADQNPIVHIEATGSWTPSLLKDSPDGPVYAARLSGAQVKFVPQKTGQEAQVRAIERDLARDCFFSTDAHGQVVEVRFDPTVNPLAQSLVRSMITITQFVRSDAADASWVAEERDTTGRYRAKYERKSDSVYEKQKLGYVEKDTPAAPSDPATRVAASHARFVLDTGGSVRNLDYEESVETSALGLPPFQAKTTLSLSPGEPQPEPDRAALENVFSRLPPMQPDDVAFVGRMGPSRDFDLARINGRTFESLLGDLDRVAPNSGKGPTPQDQVFVALVSLLRQDKQSLTTAGDYVLSGKGSHGRLILDALRDAGTPDAQAVLVDLLDRAKPQERLQVLQRLSRLGHPTPATVSRIASCLRDPVLHTQAEFGLGAAAFALETSDPETSKLATESLLSELRVATNATELANTLAGLGTAGGKRILAAIKPYLNDKNSMVRSAAADALRRIPGTEADDLLIAALGSDPNDSVRRTAMHTERKRTPSARVLTEVDARVRVEPSPSVRLDALALLADWRKAFPKGRATVEWLSEHDPDDKVQKAAKAQLASWTEGS